MDSPDPLAASPTPPKRTRRSLAPTSANTSPEKGSPSKSFIMSTGAGVGASPWKIKVTVEAGPMDENIGTPTRPNTRSKTTTVPLKDADGSSPTKRRGRPRKSEGGKKRTGTPARRRKSIVNVGLESSDAEDVDPNYDPKPKKGRGRPRKSIVAQQAEEPTTIVVDAPEEESIVVAQPDRTPQPTTTDTRENARQRLPTPVRPPGWNEQEHTPIPDTSPAKPTPTEQTAQIATTSDQGNSIEQASQINILDFNPSDSEEEDAPVAGLEIGDDTMLRSEDFSMVSIDSLPSMQEQNHLPTPSESEHSSSRAPTPVSKAGSNTRQGSIDDSSILSTPFSQATQAILGSMPPRATPAIHIADTSAITPSYMPSSPPAMPPTLQVPPSQPMRASTPKLQRVVRAGIALQGATRSPSNSSNNPRRDREASQARLDDLFAGFSEGTRRELQAGLRFGQQLAERAEQVGMRDDGRRQNVRQSRAARRSQEDQSSSSTEVSNQSDSLVVPKQRRQYQRVSKMDTKTTETSQDPFAAGASNSTSTIASHARLPTPEEKDDYILSVPPTTAPAEVEYPTLTTRMSSMQLLSPPRNADATSRQREPTQGQTPPPTQDEGVSMESIRWHKTQLIESIKTTDTEALKAPAIEISDIWQEEASRSSNDDPKPSRAERRLKSGNKKTSADHSNQANEKDASADEIFKPKRAKLPRTWRRTSGNDFSYSDESDPVESSLPVVPDIATSSQAATKSTAYTEKDVETPGSEDSGLFFHRHLPNLYSKDKKSSDKVDLSALLKEESSYIKPSSPAIQDSSSKFVPVQSSPLRPKESTPLSAPSTTESQVPSSPPDNQEATDIWFQSSVINTNTGSRHPSYVEQSSPIKRVPVNFGSDFATSQVDGSLGDATLDSVTRQLQGEILAATSGQSGDEDADRTTASTSMMTPSQSEDEYEEESSVSMPAKDASTLLAPQRSYAPLFGSQRQPQHPTQPKATTQPTKAQPAKAQPATASSGIFGRFTSALWSAVPSISSAPPTHPTHRLLQPLPMLPSKGPWSKTHYKVLDSLYQLYKKSPSAFSASKDAENAAALTPRFAQFVNVEIQNWGYHVLVEQRLVVLAAVFWQLLKLDGEAQYAQLYSRKIEPNEGVVPEEEINREFTERDVVVKLFSVVAGEMIRRDEKVGRTIDRRPGQFFVRFSGHAKWLNVG